MKRINLLVLTALTMVAGTNLANPTKATMTREEIIAKRQARATTTPTPKKTITTTPTPKKPMTREEMIAERQERANNNNAQKPAKPSFLSRNYGKLAIASSLALGGAVAYKTGALNKIVDLATPAFENYVKPAASFVSSWTYEPAKTLALGVVAGIGTKLGYNAVSSDSNSDNQ